MTESYDAIVVGLGVVGAAIAGDLAAAGARVLGLEKGADHQDADFEFKQDELRYHVRGDLLPLMDTDPLTWRANGSQTAALLPWAAGGYGRQNPLNLPPSTGTGGGSVHWTCIAWRFREADFRMRSAVEERFGRHALTDDVELADWPMSYAELEPYYDRVEWELGVCGQAGNVRGAIQPGGNALEAPRERGYPMAPLQRGAGDERFRAACERLGMHAFPTPMAINSQEYQGRPACVACGWCHGYPCHVGAKLDTRLTCLEKGRASGNLEIRPHARVFHVDRGAGGRRAEGVSYFDADGRRHHVRAPIVVLACYALENTRLLLASGVTGGGHVGRNFMTHNYAYVTGVLPEDVNPFMGPDGAGSTVDDFTSELIPDNDDGVVWGSPVLSYPGDLQPLAAAHTLPPTLPRWGAELKRWLAENYRRMHKMHAQTSSLPSRLHYCDLDPTVRDPFGQPALRITHDWTDYDARASEYFLAIKRRIAEAMGMVQWWEDPATPGYHLSTHEVGTHRMGDDPRASAVNRFGETHECAGLFALGGGQFPTLATYNPTETIQALAFYTSDHLLDRLGAERAPVPAPTRTTAED
jgi:gluconate 2-dehydrogenase alpha chain